MEHKDGRISVLLADDEAMFRAGVAMLLRAEPDLDVVAEAGDGSEAVELARRFAIDVVVMDVRMPGMDGIAATRLLAEAGEADRLTKVLVVSSHDGDDTVFGALRAGASGFLLKRKAPGELLDAIRHVARGDAWIDPAVAGRVIAALSAAPDQETEQPLHRQAVDAVARLTAREKEVLALMAGGSTNLEIRRRLTLSEATVKTHVSRVLMKTGAHDRTRAVVLAYQSGLVTP